jgi:hypothetical protein
MLVNQVGEIDKTFTGGGSAGPWRLDLGSDTANRQRAYRILSFRILRRGHGTFNITP